MRARLSPFIFPRTTRVRWVEIRRPSMWPRRCARAIAFGLSGCGPMEASWSPTLAAIVQGCQFGLPKASGKTIPTVSVSLSNSERRSLVNCWQGFAPVHRQRRWRGPVLTMRMVNLKVCIGAISWVHQFPLLAMHSCHSAWVLHFASFPIQPRPCFDNFNFDVLAYCFCIRSHGRNHGRPNTQGKGAGVPAPEFTFCLPMIWLKQH